MNGSEEPTTVRGFRRAIYIALAALFFVIGMIGVVLPVLPTTPFLLLMSFFLIRVSPVLHDRIIELPIVGGPIRDWREQQAVRVRVKLLAYTMVLAVVSITLFSDTTGMYVKIATGSLALLGMWVIWRLPTIP